jgi:hypothetical protein
VQAFDDGLGPRLPLQAAFGLCVQECLQLRLGMQMWPIEQLAFELDRRERLREAYGPSE